MATAKYSLHKLDFFELDINKVCDLPNSSHLVCSINSISYTDVINKICEVENETIARCLARNPKMTPWVCEPKDIYVTSTDWIRQEYRALRGTDNEDVYRQAFEFIKQNKVQAAFGVDADETDTYLLVVEYIDE